MEINILPIKEHKQIWLEFLYLCAVLIVCLFSVALIQFKWFGTQIEHHNKVYLFSFLGGLLGGWAFDTKWFYRVIARGKDKQYKWKWEDNKFFWRFFIPYISALVAFVTYLAIKTDFIPIIKIHDESAACAFSASFIFGYFSDSFIGIIADKIGLKNKSKKSGKEDTEGVEIAEPDGAVDRQGSAT